MSRRRVHARAGTVVAEKRLRRNKPAENRFSHEPKEEKPRSARTPPSLPDELLKRGITTAEITERAHNFDNDVSQADADRYASAISAYLYQLTKTTRRVGWCVVPGYEFDARTSINQKQLVRPGWGDQRRTYTPEEFVAASKQADEHTARARIRLLEETKPYPYMHEQVQKMGTAWVAASAEEKTAREIVIDWLLHRV
jgi:hypothetical protein